MCNKRRWVKTWLLKKSKYTHINLLKELQLEPDDYRNYMQIPEEVYMELLDLISPYIQKEDTVMRQSISPHERLSSTLRWLATGRSLQDLKYRAVISPQALGKIIPETCKAICTVLWKETDWKWRLGTQKCTHVKTCLQASSKNQESPGCFMPSQVAGTHHQFSIHTIRACALYTSIPWHCCKDAIYWCIT